MKDFFDRYPLLLPLTALCLGILQGFNGSPLWIFLTTGFISLLVIFYRRRRTVETAIWILLLVLIFSLAFFRTQHVAYPPLPEVFKDWIQRKQKVPVLIQAQGFCQSQGDRSYFDGDLAGYYQNESFHSVSARLRWFVNAPRCAVEPGRWYRSRAGFRPVHRYQNPSSFDYPAYLQVQGLAGTGAIDSAQELVPLQDDVSWLNQIRERGMALIQEAALPPIQRETMMGLFWGTRPTESSGLLTIFRDTGLAHLLVVSGFHFTLLFGIFFYLFQGLGFFFGPWADRGWVRKGAMALAFLPAILFSYWVGWGPPVLRALASIFLAVMAYWIDGVRDFLSLALLVALLMLVWWPLYLFDPSFLFSFGAVLTLVIFSRRWLALMEPLEARWSRLGIRAMGFVLALPLATVAVNGVLYPLMALYFHRTSWVAPLANGLTEPFFSLLLLPGLLAATILAPWGWGLALAMVNWLGAATGWVLRVLETMAAWDWAASWVGPPHWWLYLAWLLGLMLFSRARRWRTFFLGLGILACLGLIDRAFTQRTASGILKLSVVDVGQGDSLLLELPDGSAVLVDGGGIPYSDFDMGEKVVLPELLRRGIRELRAMVLTHPDGDHAFGLISLARDLKVAEFWTATPWSSLAEVPELAKVITEKNIPVRALSHGDMLFAAKTSFEVLWPPAKINSLELSRNDRSLVLRVCCSEICFALTGDLEKLGEQGLLAQGDEIKSQVLKVGHHGSRTSTSGEFLQAIHPKIAVISAGKDNRFGMPHREVLERLGQEGIEWFSTERDGQMVIATDGKEIFIERVAFPQGRDLGFPEELSPKALPPLPGRAPIPNY